jgi:methionyl-tRNA synthetase
MIEPKPTITLNLRVGQVISAERVPDTDKLLKLMVSIGEETPRQIISGIAEYYPEPAYLVGRQFLFIANLEARTIKGLESNGMILAATDDDGVFALMHPTHPLRPGSQLR